jgi:hypothetical protein
MKLYKLEASNYSNFFGSYYATQEERIERDVKIIAQTPNCDAFLLLAEDTFDEVELLELLDSAPTGFDFTYCQEWGLEVNDAVVDRVIADLN